jgi:5-hydroxyisourate hydrolase
MSDPSNLDLLTSRRQLFAGAAGAVAATALAAGSGQLISSAAAQTTDAPAPAASAGVELNAMAEGRLTTHVLDTARGKPAAGVKIMLYRVSGNSHRKISETVTNSDGRTDAALLSGKALTEGQYELVFCAGDYLRAQGAEGILFLDEIPVRFGVPDAGAHYHVPLLLSPFGYSTYRGS